MGREVKVRVSNLVLTNPDLDKQKIREIQKLGQEKISLLRPRITVANYGDTYFVLDGNNRVEALKQLGIREATVNLDYTYASDPTPELRKFLGYQF